MSCKSLIFTLGPAKQDSIYVLENTVHFRFIKETIVVDPSSKYGIKYMGKIF